MPDALPQTHMSVLTGFQDVIRNGVPGRIGGARQWVSFEEIDEKSNRFASFLGGRGVGQGDRVAAMMANSVDMVIAMLGVLKLGAVWAPMNTALIGDWLHHQLTDIDPAAVVADAAFLHQFDDLPSLPDGVGAWIVAGDPSGEPMAGRIAFDDYLEASAKAPDYRPHPTDLAFLIYTSGTTGRSKGCMISHAYACNAARLLGQSNLRASDDVLLISAPLSHMSALANVVQTLTLGGGVYLAKRFVAETFWEEIEWSGATTTSLMGLMASLLLAAPSAAAKRCHGQLRVVTGMFSEETAAALKDSFGVGRTATTMFGQTEGTYLLNEGGRPPKSGSCGVPTDSFDVRVFDENDVEVGPGEIGEFVYRPIGPNVMFSGYWQNPEATMDRCRNLWRHSGDFGYRDEDGYFFFVDRADDRIRRSGENISTVELDAVFSGCPDLAAAATHAVRSEISEDEVKLTAVLAPGSKLTPEALSEWANARIPRYASPRFIEFRQDLPKNATGKVLKHQLRAEGVTAATWDRRQAKAGAPTQSSDIPSKERLNP